MTLAKISTGRKTPMQPISVIEDGKTLLIKLPAELDGEFIEQMITESKAWLLRPVALLVFDFKDVQELKLAAYRPFVILSRLAKQGDKHIKSIGLSHRLELQIKSDGVLGSFNPFSPADLAKERAGVTAKPTSTAIDVALINPFVEATVSTLQIQCQTPSTPGRPTLLKVEDKEYNPSIGILGIISLSTAKFHGSIALAFPEKVYLKIYENMFGEKHDSISSDLQDAAAEILNIIYGTAKTQLNQTPGFDLQPAIPMVLAGEKLKIHQKTREKIIVLPFESAAGPFQMEIALDSK